MATLFGDLRHAWRVLVTSPVTTAAALATLALGIGANAAFFSLLNAVLLRPLPYPEPERLVKVYQTVQRLGLMRLPVSLPEFLDYQARATAFESLAVYQPRQVTRTSADYPRQVEAASVSANLLDLLGARVARGRGFVDDDHHPGGERVVIVTDAHAGTVGGTIALDGVPHTVIGVLPRGFQLPGEPGLELLLPIQRTADAMRQRDTRNYSLLARVRRGVDTDRAERELHTLAGQLATGIEGLGARLVPLQEDLVGDVRRPLVLLMAAVGFVLLIGCANVAHLSLARAAARRREMAIRAALGASRGHLVRQLLTESLLLAFCGGLVGILAAAAMVDLLIRLSPATLPRVEQTRIDAWVLLFGIVVTLAAGVLFGLGSALQASRPAIDRVLKEDARTSTGGRGLLRGFLVGSEVALALALLVCAGLVIRGFVRLLSEDAGFDPRGVLTMTIDLPSARYPELPQREAFFRDLLGRVAALPGVERAAIVNQLPLGGSNADFGFTIVGRPPRDAREFLSANWRLVSQDYFRAMRIPLRQGRLLTEQDRAQAPPVMVINETMARTLWPQGSAIGQSIKLGSVTSNLPAVTIVGIVGDVRHTGLHEAARPEMYMPYPQMPEVPALFRFPPMTLVVRAAPVRGDPAALTEPVRRILRDLDPQQAVGRVSTMEELLAASVATRRFAMRLLGGFAAVALFLAVIGTYGVMAYLVGQRTREIAIRMALGAERGGVLRLIMRQAAPPIAIGGLAGLAIAWAAGRLLSELLHGISASDPVTFATVPLLMGMATVAASWAPAWRAATVDPAMALRADAAALAGTLSGSMRQQVRTISRRVTSALSSRGRARATDEPQLLAGLAEAARAARTIDELFALVAEMLRVQIGVERLAIYTRDERSGRYGLTTCRPAYEGTEDLTLDRRALSVRRLERLSMPLAIDEHELRAWLQASASSADASSDAYEARRRECDALRRVGASWLVPIRMNVQMIGILCAGPRADGQPLGERERELLIGMAAQIAFLIQNASLVARVAEQERLARELKMAAAVQQRLLPERAPDADSLDLAGFCRPARTVGGDYYDYVRLDRSTIGIVIADVAGKGMSAALLMAVIQASWRSLAPLAGRDLPNLVTKLHGLLYGSTADASYATMVCARYEEESRRLQFVNAGHNPPFLLKRGHDRPVPLTTGGPVIGLLPIVRYEDDSVVLEPGDLVVAYTDGVVEALDARGEEFGEARLLAAIRAAASAASAAERSSAGAAQAITARVARTVLDWIGDAPQHDDLTIVVLEGR